MNCFRVRRNPSRMDAKRGDRFRQGDFGTGIGLVTTNGLATATGEDRRAAGETCPLLLVGLGGESCDETVVWQDAPADSRGPGSREIDPEPPGTERCLTKLDGKAAVSGLGTHVAAAPALSRAAGPRQRTNRALEPREGYMLWGGWELKRKYRIGGLSVNLTGIMPSAIL